MSFDTPETVPNTDGLTSAVEEDVNNVDASAVDFSGTSEIIDTYTNTEIEDIVSNIENNEAYKDPVEGSRLFELLKNRDYVKAITKLFNFIGVLLDKGMTGSSHDAFKNTGADINFAGMTEDELKSNIGAFKKSIKSASSITKSLHLTSMISRAKDSLAQKEKGIDAKDKYGLLAANVKVGDVLLINKRRDTSFGTQALRGFEEKNPADYGHSVLVSSIDPVKITHSTGKKESGSGSGVEEIKLEEYFSKHRPSDVLAMNQKDPHRQASLDYAKEKIGKGYDDKIAAIHGIGGIVPESMKDNAANNDEYNCVELIAKSYKNNSKIKGFSHPNQFLGNNGTFTPSYMTEIG